MPIFYLDSGSIDRLEISSSLLVSGSFIVSGSMTTTGGLTGSLQGTASWATNALTASFAPAYVLNSQTSSMTVLSASFSSTSSFIQNAQSASYVLQAVSASFATSASRAISSSIAVSSSYALTSSFALSASWAPGGSGTITIQDEGSPQGSANTVNFTGAGVTATVVGNTATVNIPGGGGLSGGIPGAIPKWDSSTTLGNSYISESFEFLKIQSGSTESGIQLDFNSNTYQIGNYSIVSPGTGTKFSINPGTQQITTEAYDGTLFYQAGFFIDQSINNYAFGYLDNTSQGLQIYLDGPTNIISARQGGSPKGIKLNYDLGSFEFGGMDNPIFNPTLNITNPDKKISMSGSVYLTGSLTVDVGNELDVLSAGGFTGNQNNYLELYVQNLSSGVSASTDIVAYADNASETSNFIDLGINSSGIAIGYSFGNANDGYVYNSGGNLFIGNNTAFSQPTVSEQSLFLFSNASGSPDLTITGSRVGIRKSGSLNNTLDVNGGVTVSGSMILTAGSGFTNLLASETLTAGDLVNVFSGGVRRASSTDTTRRAHGFVTASYSATNPVIVFYSGLNTNVSGLTAGARYFLSASGAESTAPPVITGQLSQEIGVAISTTALLFQPGPAIIT